MKALESRKSAILQAIIETYIATAEPIGSKFLVSHCEFDLSAATIRHDMCELEQAGFLFAPHPSSGRIPTQKAYQYYLDYFLSVQLQPKWRIECLEQIKQIKSEEEKMKILAKALAQFSGEMVIVAFDPHWSYYTGVSQLFHKPDFAQLGLLHSLSDLLDQFDEVITNIFDSIPEKPQVFLGAQNPFGKEMAAVVTRCRGQTFTQGTFFGLIGPLRMNYAINIGLMETLQEILTLR
jgi:transcriptional regulator of heat shock response